MNRTFVLALDQGTTSSRAILFDRAGAVCAAAQQEYTQHYPQPGWVEHDADEIWETQLAVAQRVLRENNVSAGQIAALGIATPLAKRAGQEALKRAFSASDRPGDEGSAR